MRQHIFAAVLVVATSSTFETMLQPATQALTVDGRKVASLESLRRDRRPLLVFAPTDSDPRFVDQARLFARGGRQLEERQVLFVPLVLKKEARSYGVGLASSQVVELSQSEALNIRQRLGIAPKEFAVVLIGKDGGEKFRAHIPVTIERLNALIDAMPMRQQEVRNGNSK